MHMNAGEINSFLRHFSDAYAAWMQPLNSRHNLPAKGLDILLFLANNPGLDTAGDICRCRHLKPALVSLTVEKLVQSGWLERQSIPGDRRKDRLVCTESADGIIRQGRARQAEFAAHLNRGLTQEEISAAMHLLDVLDRNLLTMQTEDKDNGNK